MTAEIRPEQVGTNERIHERQHRDERSGRRRRVGIERIGRAGVGHADVPEQRPAAGRAHAFRAGGGIAGRGVVEAVASGHHRPSRVAILIVEARENSGHLSFFVRYRVESIDEEVYFARDQCE